MEGSYVLHSVENASFLTTYKHIHKGSIENLVEWLVTVRVEENFKNLHKPS